MKQKIMLDSNALLRLLDTKISGIEPDRFQRIMESPLAFVFGSWAANLQKPSSDLDLLIVSEESSHWRGNGLDVVSVTPSMLKSDDWQRGELATHVASYGIQIKGAPHKLSMYKPGLAAILGKLRRIRAYLNALELRWARFDAILKQKYSKKIYLDVLRLELLEMGIAVPPTALLRDKAVLYGLDPSAKLLKISSPIHRSLVRDLSRNFPKPTPPTDKTVTKREPMAQVIRP